MSATIFCNICGKEFARASQLKVHGERKRPCRPPILGDTGDEGSTISLVSEFRTNSVTFNKSLTKEVRQATGIFFTPKKVRDLLFQKLADLGISAPTRILEPSFGSGEFLFDARERYPAAKLVGVEMNKDLFLSTATMIKETGAAGVALTNNNFLTWVGTADLIIGNPPYFVIPASEAATSGSELMATGRPNIYIQFLYKCLDKHLVDGGHLAFIIPTSIYNCAYYQPMRDYIATHAEILHVETLDKPGFFETTQETTLLILRKAVPGPDQKFMFRSNSGNSDNLYISPYYKELYTLTAGSTTIRALGLAVKTGNVVWNQVKENLTADETKGTLLVYASNIKNSTLTLNNLLGTEKKQYVKDLAKTTLDGPVILVDRGYGNAVSFNSVLVDKKGFYAENHLNVIYRTSGTDVALERVAASLKDPRTVEFVQLFNGNGTLSATDLETLIPIF